MPRIKLPKSIGEYFAFQEDDRTGDFRRFHLYLPYRDGPRIERLHWEWNVSGTEEAVIGADGIQKKNARERDRFANYIENWLRESGCILVGDAPIPELRRDDGA